MKTTSQLALLSLSIALLSACSTTRQAPVVDRTPVVAPAPVKVEEPKEERGMYTVKKGDTLIRIALDHGQNYRDLVAWNNLSNPNDIKVDQVLRVLPPEQGTGVVTSPIAMPTPEVRPAPPPVPKKTAPRGDKKA